jgi:hypothetical protein
LSFGGNFFEEARHVSFFERKRAALEFLVKEFQKQKPTLSPVRSDTLLILTDGAREGETEKQGSVSGVIVDRTGQCLRHFSNTVPAQFMTQALVESSNPIMHSGSGLQSVKELDPVSL